MSHILTQRAPKDVEVGDLIQARDPVGHWYNAKVIAKAGRGASVSATVHYTRFGPSHTEKFTVAKQGLRPARAWPALNCRAEGGS